jgi:hypothetical protein
MVSDIWNINYIFEDIKDVYLAQGDPCGLQTGQFIIYF